MNFCAATEDGRKYATLAVYYAKYFKKVKMQLKQKKICTQYGEGAVTDQMCQKWFVKFLGTIYILTK